MMVLFFIQVVIQTIRVAASPWRDGKGDSLAEISLNQSVRIWIWGDLSPWDAHSPLYHG